MLLYANSIYTEQVVGDPDKWQRHEIERYISDLDYEGEPIGERGFNWSPILVGISENLLEIIILFTILLSMVTVIVFIRKRNFKRKVEILKGIDNIESKLKKQIDELERELGSFNK